jgi:putative toxin-antitoxin system antitoxin component (TIGR02293 family)
MAFTVREATIQYGTPKVARVQSIAFKGEIVRSLVSGTTITLTTYDMIEQIAEGLPIYEFEDLQAALGVTKGRLAELLSIPKATLQRRELVGALQPDESDRLIRFARILAEAIDVFDSLDKARRWLKAPQYGLGHAEPLDFCRTEAGAREVSDLLGRIEHGVYS